MRYASTAILACGMFLMCRVERVEAQTYERVQPIVLTASPVLPESGQDCPATRRAVPRCQLHVTQHVGEHSVGADRVRVGAASRWTGPAGECRRHVTRRRVPRVRAGGVAGREVQTVLRPVSAPTVPAGYVVGQGLIGQPKLYKPGQPMRNLLRYISL